MARNLMATSLVFCLLAGVAWGAGPAETCAALKMKASGKKAAAKLKCHSKAVAASRPVGTDCLSKAEDKFRAKFAKAEAAGGCAINGDALAIESKVDSFVDDVVSELFPTTTSTSIQTTTSTSTSTSTTVPTGPCQCGTPDPTRLQFTTTVGSGNCGVATKQDGTVFTNLACGGFYTGGGVNTVPLPIAEPDMGTSILRVTACNGTFLTLSAATAADTLSPRTCTAAGCLVGAPVPVPNANAPAVSYCLVRSVSSDATGTGDCAAGTLQVSLPLHWDAFLGGDLLTDAGHPGIQPCPLCEGGTCRGGPNNGLSCTPGDSAQTNGYPTSQDCPPPPGLDVSDQVIDYAPTTASVTRTAFASSFQQRVFCGFCRDDDQTGDFESPPHPCQSNADCSQPFEACLQRDMGAFGPTGGAVKTITENGAAGGDLRDHATHAATLASIFCIPPSYNATLDASNDWPGPGAVANPVTLQLTP